MKIKKETFLLPGAVSLGVLKSFRSSGVFMYFNRLSKSFQGAPGEQKKTYAINNRVCFVPFIVTNRCRNA